MFSGYSKNFPEISAIFIISTSATLLDKSFALLAILYTTSAEFSTSRTLNPLDCIILDKCVFENSVLVDKPFSKAIKKFDACVSVNNDLCKKLVSSSEFQIKCDLRFDLNLIWFENLI